MINQFPHFASGKLALNFFNSDNIIIEPEGKNTAPCIALAALRIEKINKNAIMAVFPADHLVIGHMEFEKAINTSSDIARNNQGLVTLGIEPTFPSVAYGYIQHELDSLKDHSDAFSVKAFAEKPHLGLAKRFIKHIQQREAWKQ